MGLSAKQEEDGSAARERGRIAARIGAMSEAMGGLSDVLSAARELVVGKAPVDAARLAAQQIETLLDQRRAITAALLAGKVDSQTAATASRSITECITDLRWYAERLDASQWAARQAVPAIININSPIEGMSPADIAELVLEVRRIRQSRKPVLTVDNSVDNVPHADPESI